MKILVAGAAGYLGSRITSYLSSKKHEIIAFGRGFPETTANWGGNNVKILTGDIREKNCVSELADIEIEAVVYAISLNHFLSERSIKETINTNVTPVWQLLNSLSEKGLKKFIYFSTQQVYGKIIPEKIDESYPVSPVNNYGLSHLMCEQVLGLFNEKKDCNCVNLRLSNGFGAPVFSSCDCWWLVINDLCKMAVENNEIKLQSDGSSQRDFIHIHDICRAVEVVLSTSNSHALDKMYNLGSGNTFTILEIAKIIQLVFTKKLGKEIPILLPNQFDAKNTRITNIKKFQYDTQRIKSLGFDIQVNIEAGIAEVLDYLINNKNGDYE